MAHFICLFRYVVYICNYNKGIGLHSHWNGHRRHFVTHWQPFGTQLRRTRSNIRLLNSNHGRRRPQIICGWIHICLFAQLISNGQEASDALILGSSSLPCLLQFIGHCHYLIMQTLPFNFSCFGTFLMYQIEYKTALTHRLWENTVQVLRSDCILCLQ